MVGRRDGGERISRLRVHEGQCVVAEREIRAQVYRPLELPHPLRLPRLHRPTRGDVPEADELAELIARAERPLILAGHGIQIDGDNFAGAW